MPVKEKPDDKLHIVLNPNQQQLCVYSSDLTTYMQGYYVKPINITTASRGIYALETPKKQVLDNLAGSNQENCIIDTSFFSLAHYNQPYRLVSNFKHRETPLLNVQKYTDFCIENKNQQIRLVGVKKQGHQFVCTDKDWQPYQPKKGFWSRLFGR